MNSKLITTYNSPNTTVIISSYPEKNVRYSKKVCAVGGFAKNTLETMLSLDNKTKFVVLTTKINNKEEIYEDNGILVWRVIEKNNPLSFLSLVKILFTLNKAKKVLLEFEFGSFGDTKTTAMLLPLSLLIKLLRKKQYIVFHQVVTSLFALGGHLGWKKITVRQHIFNMLTRIFLQLLVFSGNKIIVTEEIFKKKLATIAGNKNKIVTIPHGVDANLSLFSKEESRKKLGLPRDKKIVLFFGYLSWYKGADLFLDYARQMQNNDYLFVLAGGKSFTNAKKSHYREYMKQFNNIPENALLTGFVPEKKIPLYMSAADVVVLPYRTMISSSGPLSLAFSFKKPVLLSDNLSFYKNSADFTNALKKAELTTTDIFFPLTFKSFYSVLRKLNSSKLQKLKAFSTEMNKQRDFRVLAKRYDLVLNKNS